MSTISIECKEVPIGRGLLTILKQLQQMRHEVGGGIIGPTQGIYDNLPPRVRLVIDTQYRVDINNLLHFTPDQNHTVAFHTHPLTAFTLPSEDDVIQVLHSFIDMTE